MRSATDLSRSYWRYRRRRAAAMIGWLCRFAFNDDDSVRDGSFFWKVLYAFRIAPIIATVRSRLSCSLPKHQPRFSSNRMPLRFLQQGKDLLPLHTGKTFERV
jgi:hypothetical protein